MSPAIGMSRRNGRVLGARGYPRFVGRTLGGRFPWPYFLHQQLYYFHRFGVRYHLNTHQTSDSSIINN